MAGTPVTFEVLQEGSVVETQTVSLAADGSYEFQTSVQGDAVIRAKASHWLAKSQAVSLSGSVNADFSLINGDISGDNRINVLDYILLKSNYNKINVGDNPADLTGDDRINVLDYVVLKKNYNKIGD